MAQKYSGKLRNLFHCLENPDNPSLGPHLYLLGFAGIWQANSKKSKTNTLKTVIFYICVAFFFSQYCKCLVYLNTDRLKLILQYAPFHMGIIKSCFFRKEQKLWAKLITYTANTERKQLTSKVKPIGSIIDEYIGRNRRITYFFWSLAVFSNFGIFTEPYRKEQALENGTYLHIFEGFTPFSNEAPGYYAAMVIETVLGHFVSACVVGWDTLVVSIMIFYAGQLKIARVFCKNIISVGDSEKCRQNIAEFHRFYTELIRYQKLFNYLISRVMFVYLVVITINLGVCIIEIVEQENDLTSLVSNINFVVACLIQLLLFYWHANEVTEESMLVSYAVFESKWTETDKKLQKEVALLGVTTTKRITFSAGPFNEISLATFIMILRASYSFYALMNGTNDEK